jgi:catechol 2,3-dioxygenase-like lactoylglutathione lyase family enzyme
LSSRVEFLSTTPVLASLDIERSVNFLCSKLGFDKVHVVQGEYGIVSSGAIEIHFWACKDRRIAEATSCRVQVRAIEELHAQCASQAIVHPNAPLASKPWGTREFAILDPDGNLITFFEAPDAEPSLTSSTSRTSTLAKNVWPRLRISSNCRVG